MTDSQIIDSAHEQKIDLAIICRLLGNPKVKISKANLAEIMAEIRVRCGIHATNTRA